MIRLGLLAAIAIMLGGPVRAALVRARFVERSPRSAIVLWQSLGCACATALIAVAVEAVRLSGSAPSPRRAVTDFSAHAAAGAPNSGASPETLFVLAAVLIVGTLVVGGILLRSIHLARERAERRTVIDLVTIEHDAVPGVRVLPHPQPTAFSLAGVRRRVVVSSGTLELLSTEELTALVAHERAHTHARHDLVVLPFCALAAAFPSSRALARMHARVALLVEFAADDRVLRSVGAMPFAQALCRVAIASPLASTVATDDDALRRVERAFAPRRAPRLIASGSVLGAAAIVVLPLVVLLLPFGGR